MNKPKISFGSIKLSSNFGPGDKKEENAAVGAFGSFGKKQDKKGGPVAIEAESTEDEELKNVASTMGFSGFGKSAKQFDINEMVKTAKQTAQERTAVTSVGMLIACVVHIMPEPNYLPI